VSNEGQLAGIKSLKELEFLKVKGGLGKGAYGQVEMAVHLATGTKLAVKKIDKRSIANKKIRATLMREVEIHQRLNHENIIRLYTWCEDSDFLYLILEYAEGGNLFFYIRNTRKRLTEQETHRFFYQTCSGIDFLHRNGLIHRDIKPENLLLSPILGGEDFCLKICDFGWCVESDEPRSTFCGTLEYMAPEMLQN